MTPLTSTAPSRAPRFMMIVMVFSFLKSMRNADVRETIQVRASSSPFPVGQRVIRLAALQLSWPTNVDNVRATIGWQWHLVAKPGQRLVVRCAEDKLGWCVRDNDVQRALRRGEIAELEFQARKRLRRQQCETAK